MCCVSADYCAAFCSPSVPRSSYLLTVGEALLPGVNVLWTGEVALPPSASCLPSLRLT